MRAIADIMEQPVLYADIVQHKQKREQGPNFAVVWEAMSGLVRLRKQLNNNGQCQVLYVEDNNEVTKVDYAEDQNLVDAIMRRKADFAELREFYANNEVMLEVRAKMGFLPFLKKMLGEFWHADERVVIDVDPLQVSWDTSDLAYKQMNPELLRPGKTPTWVMPCSRWRRPGWACRWCWARR
jgi:hypothetical protein